MMRLLFLLFISTCFFNVYASIDNIKISKVNVYCEKSTECLRLKDNYESLTRSFVDLEHLQTILKLYILNSGVKNFKYSIFKNSNSYEIDIFVESKKRVYSVDVYPKSLEIPSILPLKEDDYLDVAKVRKTKELLQEIYQNKGYPEVEVVSTIKKTFNESVSVDFNINLGRAIVVDDIKINTKSDYIERIINRKLSSFLNKPFSVQDIKSSMEELKLLLIDYGYYLVELNLKYTLKDSKVNLVVEVINHSKMIFDVNINKDSISFLEIKDKLKDTVISYKRKISKEIINQNIREYLEANGYIDYSVNIETKDYRDSFNDDVTLNHINITLGAKSYLESLEFKGNSIISSALLKKIFYENATSQVTSGVYDKKYYLDFNNKIKEEYIKLGYVNIFLEIPTIQVLQKSKNINLTYKIREGLRAQLDNIKMRGVPTDLRDQILELMLSKEKSPFNPILFKEDLTRIKNFLKNSGYYYSELLNENESSLVKYNKDNSSVVILFDFKLDKKFYVNNAIIVGNFKTRSKVLRREFLFKNSEIITADALSKTQTNLLSLGLFNSVIITPVRNKTNKADILVSVNEKNFGLIEVAPGIRTDLGPKVSTSVSYNNIDGLHKQISFKGQVNKRINLNSLDDRRRQESKSLIEYIGLINYSENYLFDSNWNLSISLSKSRRRLFAFDADIQKMSYTVGQDFTRWFNFSFTQQLETISQYDASIERESGHFQIGAITPSVSFDFRNNRINPTSGSFFNLSWEIANPTFYSQSNDELVINYQKVISRNRFYIPFKNGTFAISLAAGVQKNFATDTKTDSNGQSYSEGYIPNIKVFRLSGMDIVRGFEDDEINRLVSGKDISEVEVDNRAYMANLKLEPRFFLTDSTMLGVFYDAGRVFVDNYDINDLRSSVGLSFKYLTPVGSLDLDYGIKLLRKRDSDGRLESPGRLHVSIGFF